MRVWVVHGLDVFERLQAEGELFVDTSYYIKDYDQPSVPYVSWQYTWMAQQMKERLPGCRGKLPWWAYCEKPDLRWVRHRRDAGSLQVRLELEVSDLLFFPGWAWNTIFSGKYLSLTKNEQEEWTAAMRDAVPDEYEWPLPEPWNSEREQSWLRLFDPDLPVLNWSNNESKVYREAVFETLRFQDVRAVTHFTGNCPLKSPW